MALGVERVDRIDEELSRVTERATSPGRPMSREERSAQIAAFVAEAGS